MITNLKIRNFKKFQEVDIELGKAVVLIGPNNSGKTTALQALALWDIGLRRWNEKRAGQETPSKRPGVTLNRRDLTAIPIPDAILLWRDQHVRDVKRVDNKPETSNVRVDVIVSGVTEGKIWECGLEFDYANEESIYCRPLRLIDSRPPKRMNIPKEAVDIRFAYLPPMSGLAANELRLDPGAINVRIGEGRTAEVLRNLCYRITTEFPTELWTNIVTDMEGLFGIKLDFPEYIKERGEVSMSYQERSGSRLDLSCVGRGAQQTLLLLAHLYANPDSVLLLDEPDAHLEILRQRQIYQKLTQTSERQGCQVIAASHSEVLLTEAARRDVVVAFVGRPHRIDDRGSQLLKSLKDLNFDQYYQAEQTGWVLYLEGSTDLAILQVLAKKLNHEAAQYLEQPFVFYIGGNQPQGARDHFFGLKEAKKDLEGVAIFDRLDKELAVGTALREMMWRQREIENYICQRETLLAFAESNIEEAGPLFEHAEKEKRRKIMYEAINEIERALKTLNKPEAFSSDLKASDDLLDPLFKAYYQKLGIPNLMGKTNYHVLAEFVDTGLIPDEVKEKLDVIVMTAKQAKPAK